MINTISHAISAMFKLFFILGILSMFVIWGVWELIDYIWIDEVIKSHHVITPTLEISVRNGIADTLYIYKQP